MKAKLIKDEEGFNLCIPKNGTNEFIASTGGMYMQYKLSLKNCQAIERGHDLDNCVDYFEKGKLYIQQDGVIILAGENGNNGIVIQDPLKTRGVGHYSDEWNPKAFCECSQKTLELMGDKKFSEEYVRNIFAKTLENSPSTESHTRMISDAEYRHSVMDELYDRITKSLQQTEWDVEVEIDEEMEFIFDPTMGISQGHYLDKPKLDENGCLILKKI